MSQKWPGGIIRKNPVTPAGPDYNGAASGIWTVNEAAYWAKQGLWPTPGVISTDPYFENVSLLMHGDGLGNASNNLFVDGSSAAAIISRNGNTTQGQLSPYSPYWSCYFDGNGDYLTVPNNTRLGFGTGAFTIECWVNPSAFTGSGNVLIDLRTGTEPSVKPDLEYNSSGVLNYRVNGATVISGGTLVIGTWSHVAICKSGTTTRMFLNGTQVGSSYTDNNNYGTASACRIGADDDGSPNAYVNGYISNVRIVKGTALYTANFTPPTSPLGPTGETALLTCAYNRFRDGGDGIFTITPVGNVAVSRFSPFQPGVSFQSGSGYGQSFTSPWAMAVDGTGDYITTNASPALGAGAGDFTLECWVYYTTSPDNSYTLGLSNAANDYGVNLEVRSGYLAVHLYTGSHSDFVFDTFGEQFRNNQWNHIALSRVSGVLYAYSNGVRLTKSTTFTTNMGTSGYAVIGGPESNKQRGFISNVRYTIGVAAYSGLFYPVPSAPLQATFNTALLTCQSSTFVDNSVNNLTINTFGDVVMRGDNAFQPGYSSVYFDGDGDQLTTANTPANFAGNNFTAECWVYFTTNSAGYQPVMGNNGTADAQGWAIITETNNRLYFYYSVSGSSWAGSIDTGVTPVAGSWTHLAVVRNGNTITFYVNGVASGTPINTSSALNSPTGNFRIGRYPYFPGGARTINGYISNVRLVNGTAVYTSNFTPSTTPLTAITNTSLLTCQNNAFTDNSTNNFVITPSGEVTVTGNSPFLTTGYYSGYFDGGGDWLSAPSNPAFAFGTGDFTMEAWVYRPATGDATIIAPGGGPGLIFYNVAQLRVLDTNNGNQLLADPDTFPLNQWVHVACTRASGTMRLFVNGALKASGSVTTNFTSAGVCYVGSWDGSNFNWTGSISNARIVKGTAVYTAAFTPSTGPLAAISGTSLLTCQNGRFIDNSTNNFTITRNGDTRVQTVNPFSSRFLGNNVGSIYFDGTGDWLLASPFTLPSTADFTLEFWLYPFAAFSSNRGLATFTGLRFGLITEAGSIYLLSNTTEFDTNTNPVPGTWNHIALTRSGGTIRIFLNGTQIGTAANNTDNFTSQGLRIGNSAANEIIPQSYMANVRFIVGTAVYTGNFTPPTVPVPSIPGTVLNLNGTNAGVFDQTNLNNLETVGDADISTAVKKYGTGSIYFDGTGDAVTLATNPALALGSGNFTVECWFYASATMNYGTMWTTDDGTNSASGIRLVTGPNNNSLTVGIGGSAVLTASSTYTNSTWNHAALVRNSGTITLYLNGTNVGTLSNTTNFSLQTFFVGRYGAGFYWNGYIDELRVTPGIARYTADFFPPPGPFPNY